MANLPRLLALASLSLVVATAAAQQPTRTGGGNATSGGTGGASPVAPPLGGGASADFTTLMDLIQTVVPADWDVDASMTPFAGGVWVDPAGMLHREPSEATTIALPAVDLDARLVEVLGKVQEATELRWFPLTQFANALLRAGDDAKVDRAVEALVGGISRIDYLHYDAARRQWYIGGPAGDFAVPARDTMVGRQTGLPPLMAEDLLTVVPHVLQSRGVFGCSIDPSDEGLAAASTVLRQIDVAEQLRRSPDTFANRLAAAVGPQRLRLINLPDGSSTGLALLIADEHMKRVGLELVDPPAAEVGSYWDAVAAKPSAAPQSLVRWWFALAESPATRLSGGEDESITYRLDRSSVRTIAEAEWMQENGQRVPAGGRDAAADEFAASFTEAFPELQQRYPIYGRLRHIFDLAIVGELIRRDCESGRAEMPAGLANHESAAADGVAATTIDSIVAVKRLGQRSIAAVVSGGVLVDAESLEVEQGSDNSFRFDPASIADLSK